MAGGKAICLDSIVIQKELRFSSLFEKPEIIILDDDTIVGNKHSIYNRLLLNIL